MGSTLAILLDNVALAGNICASWKCCSFWTNAGACALLCICAKHRVVFLGLSLETWQMRGIWEKRVGVPFLEMGSRRNCPTGPTPFPLLVLVLSGDSPLSWSLSCFGGCPGSLPELWLFLLEDVCLALAGSDLLNSALWTPKPSTRLSPCPRPAPPRCCTEPGELPSLQLALLAEIWDTQGWPQPGSW